MFCHYGGKKVLFLPYFPQFRPELVRLSLSVDGVLTLVLKQTDEIVEMGRPW